MPLRAVKSSAQPPYYAIVVTAASC